MTINDVREARDLTHQEGRKLERLIVTRSEWNSLIEEIYSERHFPEDKRGGEYDELEICGVRIRLGPFE